MYDGGDLVKIDMTVLVLSSNDTEVLLG